MAHHVGNVSIDDIPDSISTVNTAPGDYVEKTVVAGDGSIKVEWFDLSTLGVSAVSLYTGDGTLEEDRTVTGNANDLIFTGNPLFAVRDTTLIDLDGAVVINESSADVDFRVESGLSANAIFLDSSAESIGIFNATPSAVLDITGDIAVSGGAALEGGVVINNAGASVDTRIEGDTDANLVFVDASADTVQIGATTAADSSKFYVLGKISTSGELEVNGAFNHDGTTFGVYGVAPTTQPAALTAQSTSITSTAPGVADYAIQDLVQNTGWGFASQDEGNTVLAVIANLQTRVQELEDKLQLIGFLA